MLIVQKFGGSSVADAEKVCADIPCVDTAELAAEAGLFSPDFTAVVALYSLS